MLNSIDSVDAARRLRNNAVKGPKSEDKLHITFDGIVKGTNVGGCTYAFDNHYYPLLLKFIKK